MNGRTTEEHNAYHRKYRALNEEHINAQRRANYKHLTDEQREAKILRSRAYNNRLHDNNYVNVINAREWVKTQDGGIACSICLQDFDSDHIHVDHIDPLSKGGPRQLTVSMWSM